MLLLIGLLIFCYGCSPSPVAEKPDIQETASVEVSTPTREAVFVYGQDKQSPKKIIMKIGGEPKLLSAGYLQLVGLVGGSQPAALFELAGRGVSVMAGDEVAGYRLKSINQSEVVLTRND